MRKFIAALILSTAVATVTYGQCTVEYQVAPNKRLEISTCQDTPIVQAGRNVTLDAEGVTIPMSIAEIRPITVGTHKNLLFLNEIDPGDEALTTIARSSTITVKFEDENGAEKSFTAENVEKENLLNYYTYDWSLGPATKGEEDGESDEDDTPSAAQEPPDDADEDDDATSGAIRLRYAGQYGRGGIFGTGDTGRFQTTADLLIDTTDQSDPDFIDNNRLAVGVRATGLKFGRLWMHGTAGLEARVEKGFHSDVQNVDVAAKVTGWIPVLRSFTLFPRKGEFIAPPLSVTASYGYRNRDQGDTQGNGRVFEATGLYHLFFFDQYELDLSATLTVNDLDDMPAGTPRTQRMYKATMSYLQDPASGFKVLTSFESGSFGVMLKDVRQYFIGVAISRLNFTGSGKR